MNPFFGFFSFFFFPRVKLQLFKLKAQNTGFGFQCQQAWGEGLKE